MDFETFLREYLATNGVAPVSMNLHINNEQRIIATVCDGTQYVVFGDRVAPCKPPTQGVFPAGTDMFKPMGKRS